MAEHSCSVPLPEASARSQGVDPRVLEEAMEHVKSIAMEHGNSQCVVVRSGHVIWKGADIDNLHNIWSCTKSWVSMCLGLLIDDGRCTLQTRAADVVPALREHYPTATLRHFAAFVSGYSRAEGPPSPGGAASAAAAAPPEPNPFTPGKPLFPPGEKFHYNHSPDMLALVLTRLAGEPLRDLWRRRIAEPIGLDPDKWRWNDWGEVGGLAVCGGSGEYQKGICITAREIAKIGLLYVNGGAWHGRQLLSRWWIEESTSPQSLPTTPVHDPQAWYQRLPGSYGLHMWINGMTPQGRLMWPAAPPRTAAIQGNLNNFCFIIPEWRMVMVRLGHDGRIDNNQYDGFFQRMAKGLS